MVTAELAVGLPVLALVVASALGLVVAAAAQLRCTDAAAGAARLASRGEPADTVRAFVADDAPAGASVSVRTAADSAVAVVSAPLRLPLLGAVLPVRLSARAAQPLEPSLTPTSAEGP